MDPFVNKNQLTSFGIRASYATLAAWMDAGLFPPAQRVSAGRIGWRLSEIQRYIEVEVPTWGVRPRLWPPRPKRPAPEGRKRGRRPGTRVIKDADGKRHVVDAAEAAD